MAVSGRGTLCALVLFLASSVGLADCLNKAADLADRICGEIQTSGTRVLTDVNGKLNAEVSGILKKSLGNIGGAANGRRLQDVYENVLREDLAKELFNIRDCRIKILDVGRGQFCNQDPRDEENPGELLIKSQLKQPTAVLEDEVEIWINGIKETSDNRRQVRVIVRFGYGKPTINKLLYEEGTFRFTHREKTYEVRVGKVVVADFYANLYLKRVGT